MKEEFMPMKEKISSDFFITLSQGNILFQKGLNGLFHHFGINFSDLSFQKKKIIFYLRGKKPVSVRQKLLSNHYSIFFHSCSSFPGIGCFDVTQINSLHYF